MALSVVTQNSGLAACRPRDSGSMSRHLLWGDRSLVKRYALPFKRMEDRFSGTLLLLRSVSFNMKSVGKSGERCRTGTVVGIVVQRPPQSLGSIWCKNNEDNQFDWLHVYT